MALGARGLGSIASPSDESAAGAERCSYGRLHGLPVLGFECGQVDCPVGGISLPTSPNSLRLLRVRLFDYHDRQSVDHTGETGVDRRSDRAD